MNKPKGFTILEMMVAFTIFCLCTAMAFTFYHLNSRQGAGSTKRKLASETVTLAMATLRRDILQAGLGLKDRPELSMFVVNGSGATPDQLYLSCADYLDMDLSPGKTNSFFDAAASPGQGKVWFQLDSSMTPVVNNASRFIDSTTLDSAITMDSSGTRSYTKLSSVGPSDPSKVDLHTNTQPLQFNFTGSVPPAPSPGSAAPAISYKLDLTGTGNVYTMGRLLRNGVAVIGADTGETHLPVLKVTSFRVRCQFLQGAGVYKWSPDDGSFTSFPIRNLRLVEVTCRFLFRDEGGGFTTPNDAAAAGFGIPGDTTPGPWMIGGIRTLRVSPRNIVLESYL
jgi:prepilin-type N-terminal cleavage/methylation domain-containing protein